MQQSYPKTNSRRLFGRIQDCEPRVAPTRTYSRLSFLAPVMLSTALATLALFAPLAVAQLTPPLDNAKEVVEVEEIDPLDAPLRDPASERSVLAQFTSGIENREPIDQITFVENDVHQVFFFSDLRGFEGMLVRHRWSYRGQMQAEVEFSVLGPRWRVWSSKNLEPEAVGDWTVEIVTQDDETLASETFTYSAAAE